MEAAQQMQEECRTEEKRIKQEELSQQYHEICNNQKTAQERENTLLEQLPDLEKRATEATISYRYMQAAEYKCARIKAEQELLTAQNLLQTLRHGDDAERLQNLGYSLFVGYSHSASEAKSAYDQIQEKLRSNKREQEQLKTKKGKLTESQNELNNKKGVLSQKLKSFDESLPRYQEQIGCMPETDMMGALIPESVEQLQKKLHQEQTEATCQISTFHQKIEQNKQDIQNIKDQQEQLDEQMMEAQAALTGLENRMAGCQQQVREAFRPDAWFSS